MLAMESSNTKDQTTQDLPWVERHRPMTLDEVLSHDDIIRTIRRYLEKGNLPHLLFHGPPGTGKTSTILAIAKQFYGEKQSTQVLELNASDDRGIGAVRDQIKTFAETSSGSFAGKEQDGRLKLIILDEADQMTNAAQNALRRIMENYASNVRFCLVCNYISKIGPAIQSRCTGFRFTPLKPEALCQKAKEISKLEGVTVTDAGYSALMKIAKGDMRRLLNCMQAAHMAHPGEVLTDSLVYKTLGLPIPEEVDHILKVLLEKDMLSCSVEFWSLVGRRGYSVSDWVSALYEQVVLINWPPQVSIGLISRLAELEERLAMGAGEYVQLHALVAAFFEARVTLQAMTRES